MEKEPNQESTQKPKSDTKIDGVSCQINLGIGSPTHLRFARLMTSSGAQSVRDFCNVLMDAYENPPQDADSAKTIANLQKRIEELEQDNLGYRSEEDNYKREIGDLQAKLDAAIADANANAESGLGKQLQLDELRQRTDGAIILKPNPVVRYFLDEMAAKTGDTPDKILERLYLDDLQNPRSNNLPYTVTSSEIRRVMRELQKEGEE